MPSVRNVFQMAALRGVGLGAKPKDNNNPFSLIQTKPSAWQGLVPGSSGFLQFTSPMYGVRAGFINLVNTYLNKGLDTIAKIFPVYAPVGHGANDPAAYIAFVEQNTGIPRNQVIKSPDDIYKLGKSIVQFEEGNFWVSPDDFEEGFQRAMQAKNIQTIAKAAGFGLGGMVLIGGIWYFLFRDNTTG